MKARSIVITLLLAAFQYSISFADEGYRLWLKYDLIHNEKMRTDFNDRIRDWKTFGESETMNIINNEMKITLSGL